MSKQQKPVHNHPLSLPEAYVANTEIATILFPLVRTATLYLSVDAGTMRREFTDTVQSAN